MAHPERFEILILGSGKGGKLLAWDMARSGRRTAVVERRLSTRAGAVEGVRTTTVVLCETRSDPQASQRHEAEGTLRMEVH